MHNDASSIVPDNVGGANSDNSFQRILHDEAAASALFQQAKQRLLNVNRWHEWSGKGSAAFQLTDERGNKVDRHVRLGDHFRIDIPGPGTINGKGYDWVQVEAIEHTQSENEEVIAIRVRPTDDPTSRKDAVAHFFTDDASSTFSVKRRGNTVIASVQGRNEKPNLKAGSMVDNIRNTIVAAGAILGLNKPQWKGLVEGLLS